MKRLSAIILSAAIALSVCACGGGAKTAEATKSETEVEKEEQTAEATVYDQLSELDKELFDALIIMTTEDFYKPAAARILEIGDYEDRTKWEKEGTDSPLYGPDTVVVRLQGENQAGGTANHYYMVCIKAAENTREGTKDYISACRTLGDIKSKLMVSGEIGEYAELEDDYSIKSSSNKFDIKNINKAIKEYWEEMGF